MTFARFCIFFISFGLSGSLFFILRFIAEKMVLEHGTHTILNILNKINK